MNKIQPSYEEAVEALMDGEVVYLLTDTIPGLVCRAQNENAVEKIFRLKNRDPRSQLPTLISKVEHVSMLGAIPLDSTVYKTYWPGPVTLVHNASSETPLHIHRGNNEFGIRLPDNDSLINLINITGPLSATSANPQGSPSALSTEEARNYFGNKLTCYIEHQPLTEDVPSSVLGFNPDGTVIRYR